MKPRNNVFVNKYKRADGTFHFGTNTFFNKADACNAGRDSENWVCAVEFLQKETEQPKQITCTAKEALDKGLQIGDKITLECTFNGDYDEYSIGIIIERDGEPYDSKLSKSYTINFTPSEKPYIPTHNETCVIKTKNGLATKAIAVHYNNKISAISIDKEGNADCHFKAEQIEKFLPLPPE